MLAVAAAVAASGDLETAAVAKGRDVEEDAMPEDEVVDAAAAAAVGAAVKSRTAEEDARLASCP